MKRRGRPSSVDPDVQAVIEGMALEGWGPSKILDQLYRKFDAGRVPSLRTVQRVVAYLTTKDTSGPWTLADAEGDGARLILDVLAAVIEGTEGRIAAFTRAQAEWVLRIRKAAPDLRPMLVWYAARFYMTCEANGDDTAGLDTFLAFAPWQGKEAARRFHQALDKQWIPETWLHFMFTLFEGMEEARNRPPRAPLEEVEGYNDSPDLEMREPPRGEQP